MTDQNDLETILKLQKEIEGLTLEIGARRGDIFRNEMIHVRIAKITQLNGLISAREQSAAADHKLQQERQKVQDVASLAEIRERLAIEIPPESEPLAESATSELHEHQDRIMGQ